MTPAQSRAINNFEKAVHELAFKGASHPDDWGEIDAAYAKARTKLVAFFDRASSHVPNEKTRKAIAAAECGQVIACVNFAALLESVQS